MSILIFNAMNNMSYYFHLYANFTLFNRIQFSLFNCMCGVSSGTNSAVHKAPQSKRINTTLLKTRDGKAKRSKATRIMNE